MGATSSASTESTSTPDSFRYRLRRSFRRICRSRWSRITTPTPSFRLEVAEHLPETSADEFVAGICRLGPAICVSAAIPHQGGTGHRNEQWPGYWATRFRERGFVAVDCLRRQVWCDPTVEWWYAQNTIIYVRPEVLTRSRILRQEHDLMNGEVLSLVCSSSESRLVRNSVTDVHRPLPSVLSVRTGRHSRRARQSESNRTRRLRVSTRA